MPSTINLSVNEPSKIKPHRFFSKINSEVIDKEVNEALDFDAVLTKNGNFTYLLCCGHNFAGDARRIVEHVEQMPISKVIPKRLKVEQLL